MAVFASRQIVMPVVPPSTIAVTITGTGNSSSCYATINGTKQYEAGTHEVNAGDTITFCVIGSGSSANPGWVEIDGTQVLEATESSQKTYDWTVPSGISSIEIALNFKTWAYGRITVTTA